MNKLMLGLLVAFVVSAAAVLSLRAEDKPKAESGKPAEAKVVAPKVTADEVAAAEKALEEAKKLIADDKKEDAAKKLDEVAKLLAKVKASVTVAPTAPTAPAAPAAVGEGGTFTGEVRTTMTRKIPRLVVGGTQYDLTAAPNSDASVKETLDKISKGEATGTYVVKGTATGNSIAVTKITKQ